MREIKFRAWDKVSPHMYYANPHMQLDFRGRVMNLQNGAGGDDFILMQYTGLHDKNGKEIYESDIVVNSSGRKCQITWFVSPVFCGWDQKTINSIGKPNPDLSLWEGWEVIGNIFENRELLK